MDEKIFKGIYGKPTESQLDTLQRLAPQGEDVRKSLENDEEDVSKAFQTGYEVNPDNMNQASALRTEFLAPRLSQLTFGQEQMVFYNMIPKMPSASTVAQYVTFDQHGETGHSAWNNEADISNIKDPVINRGRVEMKYASHVRQLSLVSNEVQNVESPLDVLTDDAIISMAKTIEQASLYGDSSLSATGEKDGLEPDGLVKFIPEENVIDLKGENISVKVFNDAAIRIIKAYGQPDAAFMPNGVLAYLDNDVTPIQRQFLNGTNGAGNQVNIGLNVQAVTTIGGTVRLIGSNVMENDNILNENSLGDAGAPSAPTIVATPTKQDGGKFTDSDVSAGATYKAVVFADKTGSLASDEVTATLDAKDDSVDLKISFPTTNQDTPQYVAIYRKGANSGFYYLIKRIGLYNATRTNREISIEYKDVNDTMPETTDVFVGDMSPQTIRLYEFLPMFRLPLPSFNKMIQWAVVWSGALAVIAPNRWVHIKNVGYNTVYPTHN